MEDGIKVTEALRRVDFPDLRIKVFINENGNLKIRGENALILRMEASNTLVVSNDER